MIHEINIGVELKQLSLCDNVLPIAPANAQPSADSWNHFKDNVTSFTFKFLQNQMAHSKPGDNLLSSPLSTSLVMGMLNHGLDQKMKEEVGSIVNLLEDDLEQQACASKLMQDLPQMGVQIASLLYLNGAYRFNPHFTQIITQNYKARAQEGGSALDANQWSKELTGRIDNLVTPEDLMSFFVFANAFQFSGKWKHKFVKKETAKMEFNMPGEMKKPIDMMHHKLRIKYYEDDLCQAIVLPYENSGVEMLLVLPKKMDNFTFLNDASFHGILKSMEEVGAEIALPKCKLAQKVDVKENLEKMGMQGIQGSSSKNIFNMDHDATMKSVNKMYVSKIDQQTMLDIDEDGTEACTVTVLTTAFEGGPKISKSFVCDRPFFAALVNEGMPLLYSVLRNPS
jgi:serine protease inhibitor